MRTEEKRWLTSRVMPPRRAAERLSGERRRMPFAATRRFSGRGVELEVVVGDRLLDDGLDVLGVDAERVADVHGPDLRAEVVLEVEVGPDVGAGGLPVLADHHEGGQEDRLEAHD